MARESHSFWIVFQSLSSRRGAFRLRRRLIGRHLGAAGGKKRRAGEGRCHLVSRRRCLCGSGPMVAHHSKRPAGRQSGGRCAHANGRSQVIQIPLNDTTEIRKHASGMAGLSFADLPPLSDRSVDRILGRAGPPARSQRMADPAGAEFSGRTFLTAHLVANAVDGFLERVWYMTLQVGGPLGLLLFGIYFPERWRLDRKHCRGSKVVSDCPLRWRCSSLFCGFKAERVFHPAWNVWSLGWIPGSSGSSTRSTCCAYSSTGWRSSINCVLRPQQTPADACRCSALDRYWVRLAACDLRSAAALTMSDWRAHTWLGVAG